MGIALAMYSFDTINTVVLSINRHQTIILLMLLLLVAVSLLCVIRLYINLFVT